MCTTCYDSPELSTEEVKGIIDQVAAWGVEVFNPLGGEPFIRTDLEDLLAYAVRRGFYVTVTTNGTLINERRARLVAAIPSDRLHFNISLDGNERSSDQVRGAGNWRKAIAGYQRIRAADQAAGNSRRKILANTILHAGNLDHFEAVLDEQCELGFDGVQILNLFRPGDDVPPEAGNLWFHDRHMERLHSLVQRLATRVENQTSAGFRIQNTADEIRRIPQYYSEDLQPLEAPCWAGWKELYINADGQAIMCDGQLDFLAGRFGNVRQQTLREIWTSPELKRRREVVKACSTPCLQKCYLRSNSDSARALLQDGVGSISKQVVQQLGRLLPTVQHQPEVVLRMELSDVQPPNPLGHDEERWRFLTRDCPEEPGPERWEQDRDRGYLDFGRGFMGFEIIRSIVSDLRSSRVRLGCLELAWRGEPLLHPEILPILRFLGVEIRDHRLTDSLRIQTDGRFLTRDLIHALDGTRTTWVLDVDRGKGAGLDLLLKHRHATHSLVVMTRVCEGFALSALPEPAQEMPVVLGGRPSEGDALWLRREDHNHFQENAVARRLLEEWAERLGLPAESGRENGERRCRAPHTTPVISWDAKVTLCPWDTTLENQVGDVCDEPFSRIWNGEVMHDIRRSCDSRGVPDKTLCRDCPMPWSPNHGS